MLLVNSQQLLNVKNLQEVGSPASVVYMLELSDASDVYIRINTNSNDGILVVPTDNVVDFPRGTRFLVKNSGVKRVFFSANGLTINLNGGQSIQDALLSGNTVELVKVGNNEWDLNGLFNTELGDLSDVDIAFAFPIEKSFLVTGDANPETWTNQTHEQANVAKVDLVVRDLFESGSPPVINYELQDTDGLSKWIRVHADTIPATIVVPTGLTIGRQFLIKNVGTQDVTVDAAMSPQTITFVPSDQPFTVGPGQTLGLVIGATDEVDVQ